MVDYLREIDGLTAGRRRVDGECRRVAELNVERVRTVSRGRRGPQVVAVVGGAARHRRPREQGPGAVVLDDVDVAGRLVKAVFADRHVQVAGAIGGEASWLGVLAGIVAPVPLQVWVNWNIADIDKNLERA